MQYDNFLLTFTILTFYNKWRSLQLHEDNEKN